MPGQGSDATSGVLSGSRWRLAWLRRRSMLVTVAAAQVAEISVATVEKRRLLLEVQGRSWCRQLVLSMRRKRGVTHG